MKLKLNFVQAGHTDTIDVDTNVTVSAFRSQVAQDLDTQPKNVVFTYRGSSVADGGTLQAAGIQEGSTIRVQTLNSEEEETPVVPEPLQAPSRVATAASSSVTRELPRVPAPVVSVTKDLPRPEPRSEPRPEPRPEPRVSKTLIVLVTVPDGSVRTVEVKEEDTVSVFLTKLGYKNTDKQVFSLNYSEGEASGGIKLKDLPLESMSMLTVRAGPVGGQLR